MAVDWNQVRDILARQIEQVKDEVLSEGQREVSAWLAKRIDTHGVLIADEVGLGKTRIACALIDATLQAGGKVAVIAPPRLLYQWQGEWRQYVKALTGGSTSAAAPVMLRSRWSMFADGTSYPLTDRHHWLLLSSQFAAFRIRRDNDALIALLTLLGDAIKDKTGETVTWGAGKTVANELQGTEMAAYRRAATYLARTKPRRERYAQVLRGARLLSGLDGVRAKLAAGTDGRALVHEVLGDLLGEVDLVIIDEAHKSREYAEDGQETALGRLLTNILRTGSTSRRVALTATPVELDVSQWQSMFARIGVGGLDLQAAKAFQEALRALRTYPTDVDMARRVAETAAVFQKTFAPYIVRRLRTRDRSFRALLPDGVAQQDLAHPHRAPIVVNDIVVDPKSRWRDDVLALEFLGKSAKGMPGAHVEKLVDRRFASGFVDEELLRGLAKNAAVDVDPTLARKRARMQFWAQKIELDESDVPSMWLMSHPRLRAAIGRIEHWTQQPGLDEQNEKVLVFGTFTGPLRRLRDCLNARDLLRQLGQGLPALHGTLPVDLIAFERDQMKQNGELPPDLANATKEELERRLETAAAQWERMRRNLAETLSEEWLHDALYPDEKREKEHAELHTVIEYLRDRVLTRMLARGSELVMSPDERRASAQYELQQLLSSLAAEGEDQNDGDGDDEARSELTRLTRLVRDEQASDGTTGIQRSPTTSAVYLGGGVKPASQRLIQARFNEEGAKPNVLICQSVVGREGLNLHKACRVVLLFHPEWNPGVVEQQIGRVDRIASRWEKLARAWHELGDSQVEFPRIVVEALCFAGTYDEFQTKCLNERMAALRAQLFGEFLAGVETSDEVRAILQGKEIDFSPPPLSTRAIRRAA
jgi:hypothetical protein